MDDSMILIPDKNNLVYHLLQSGQNGYWCDEAKVFFGESLRQFAEYGHIDLNSIDELQIQFLKSFDDVEQSSKWVFSQTKETLCTELELWDFIFSNSKLTVSFMNHWDTNSDFQSISEVVRKNQIGCYADFKSILHYLHSNKDGCHNLVKFRLNYLPQTIKYFEQVKSSFNGFPMTTAGFENWDEVKNILIHENLEDMQKSYTIWGKFANSQDDSDKETIKKTIDEYLTRKIMNNTDRILSLYPKILQDENILLSASGMEFLNKVAYHSNERHDNEKILIAIISGISGTIFFNTFALTNSLGKSFFYAALFGIPLIFGWGLLFNHPKHYPEIHFIEEFQSWGYPMDLLCTILADESLSIQLNNLIKNGKQEKWKDLFTTSFANVLNKPIEPVYQTMLSVVENKRESLEFLKYLKEMHVSETENGILAELQLGLENISDAKTMSEWHQELKYAYTQAVQGELIIGNLNKILSI